MVYAFGWSYPDIPIPLNAGKQNSCTFAVNSK